MDWLSDKQHDIWLQKKKHIKQQFENIQNRKLLNSQSQNEVQFINLVNHLQQQNNKKRNKAQKIESTFNIQLQNQLKTTFHEQTRIQSNKFHKIETVNSQYQSQHSVLKNHNKSSYQGLSQTYYRNTNMDQLHNQDQYDVDLLALKLESIKQQIMKTIDNQNQELDLQKEVNTKIKQLEQEILQLNNKTRCYQGFKNIQNSRFDKLEGVSKISQVQSYHQNQNLKIMKEVIEKQRIKQQEYLSMKKNQIRSERSKIYQIEDKVTNYEVEIDQGQVVLADQQKKIIELDHIIYQIVLKNEDSHQIQDYINCLNYLKQRFTNYFNSQQKKSSIELPIRNTNITEEEEVLDLYQKKKIITKNVDQIVNRKIKKQSRETDIKIKQLQSYHSSQLDFDRSFSNIKSERQNYLDHLNEFFRENNLKELIDKVVQKFDDFESKQAKLKQKYQLLLDHRARLLKETQELDQESIEYLKKLEVLDNYDSIEIDEKKLTLLNLKFEHDQQQQNDFSRINRHSDKQSRLMIELMSKLHMQILRLSILIIKAYDEEFILLTKNQQDSIIEVKKICHSYIELYNREIRNHSMKNDVSQILIGKNHQPDEQDNFQGFDNKCRHFSVGNTSSGKNYDFEIFERADIQYIKSCAKIHFFDEQIDEYLVEFYVKCLRNQNITKGISKLVIMKYFLEIKKKYGLQGFKFINDELEYLQNLCEDSCRKQIQKLFYIYSKYLKDMKNNIEYSKAKYAVFKLLRKSKHVRNIKKNRTTEFINECTRRQIQRIMKTKETEKQQNVEINVDIDDSQSDIEDQIRESQYLSQKQNMFTQQDSNIVRTQKQAELNSQIKSQESNYHDRLSYNDPTEFQQKNYVNRKLKSVQKQQQNNQKTQIDQSSLNQLYEKLDRETHIVEHHINFTRNKYETFYDKTFKKEYVYKNHPLLTNNKIKHLNRQITTASQQQQNQQKKDLRTRRRKIITVESVEDRLQARQQQRSDIIDRNNIKSTSQSRGQKSNTISPYKQKLNFQPSMIRVNQKRLETML